MDDFSLEDYMDSGCPVCGAEPNEDCDSECAGIPVAPSMYSMVEEQMSYVAHKVSRQIMRQFRNKILTEKVQDIAEHWGDYIGFAEALVEADTLESREDVLNFIKNPNDYLRYFVIWNELGKPTNPKRETWTMFMEAIRNTNGKQT